MKAYSVPQGKVLVLRTCNADLKSHGGFQWPESGPVECPDWSPEPECGHGLHGLLWGQGDSPLLDWSVDARWLVVEVAGKSLVDLSGKVKFPAGKVVYCGDRLGATSMIYGHAPAGTVVVGLTLTGGYRSTLTGGDGSTLTGGDRSTLTGGDGSTLTGGCRSTLTGGDGSTLTGGYRSTLTGGDGSTLTGGDRSTLTGCIDSTLTGGDRSTLTGGYRSTLTGGDGSTLTFRRWDGTRYRLVTVYPGENGIEANKPYKLDTDGNVVPA